MISVILYGRNDAHGYNLHRRAALSLNCIAEVLSDPDDELIFVDYNTPDELPTFIEAIADTLTERCLDRLRVLRVAEATHDQQFAARTHLPAIEPVARNVAARRANPANRWLLSTNTDMIFVPFDNRSVSDICRDLPDGFYALPRFEIPEWLWEWLPRADPRRAVAEVGRLAPRIRIDEPTVSHEWIRFDAPGDFQLMLREDFVAIDGFDEEMLLGYHVDSNLSRRMLLHRGSIETLEEQVAGYHCNHNRTRTVYHGTRVANDLQRFFYGIEAAELPDQRTTWGLPHAEVQEVPIRHGVSSRCAAVLSEVIPAGPRSGSDAYNAPYSITYDSGHVVPHVVDTLVVSPLSSRIGYLGGNSVLQQLLRSIVERLGFEHPLTVAAFADLTAVEQIAGSADVLIIDLGVDVSQQDAPDEARTQTAAESHLPELPTELVHALPSINRLIELERARYEQTKHLRPMMLINSSAAFWDAYVLAQFDCSYTTIHSRVRRATVKPASSADSAAAEMEFIRAYRMMRWSTRLEGDAKYLVIRRGQSVEIGELDVYDGFGTGWLPPEDGGIWTNGPRSELRLALEQPDAGGQYLLTLWIGMVCVGGDERMKVDVLADGDSLASRDFGETGAPLLWQVEVPEHASRNGRLDLVFLLDAPRSPRSVGWSTDDRLLGLHIRRLALKHVDRAVPLGTTVPFTEDSGAERLLGDGWSMLEPSGVWSVGPQARVTLRPSPAVAGDLEIVLDAVPFVAAEHPRLDVELWAYGQRVGAEVFRYGEPTPSVRARLRAELLHAEADVELDLRLRHPARPVDLGLSSDARRLGLHLRSLTVREPRVEVAAADTLAALRRLRRQLRRSLRSSA